MTRLLFAFFAIGMFFFTACNEDVKEDPKLPGDFEVEFDNIALIDGVQRQLELREVGSTEYDYTNGMGQEFNITFLRYFITDVVIEGEDGAYYEVPTSVSATESKGYYLIDEADKSSQLIRLEEVPAGDYNKITFTIGVEEEGVTEGAAGGVLDPATNGMFWNWNSGYVAMKIEGQSPISVGGASGNSIKPENDKGIVFHVGGWKDVEGTAFIYNNKRISLDFDTKAKVESKERPHVHLTVDALKLFEGQNMIDFTGNINVHRPLDGKPIAENMVDAFKFDHVHQ